MHCLLIDAVSSEILVALQSGTKLFEQRSSLAFASGGNRIGAADVVFDMLDALCGVASTNLSDVARLVVVTGPGSFNGVRVGMATANGIASASKADIVGLHRFAAAALSQKLSPDDVFSIAIHNSVDRCWVGTHECGAWQLTDISGAEACRLDQTRRHDCYLLQNRARKGINKIFGAQFCVIDAINPGLVFEATTIPTHPWFGPARPTYVRGADARPMSDRK